jgi:hypothetical protein
MLFIISFCQGMKDPISDSNAAVAMLKEHCDGVIIKELDAGKENFIYLFYFLFNNKTP